MDESSSPEGDDPDKPPLAPREVHKQGTLRMRGRLGVLRPRVCWIEDRTFFVAKSEAKRATALTIPLFPEAEFEVHPCQDPVVFKVISASNPEIEFFANSPEDRDAWVLALRMWGTPSSATMLGQLRFIKVLGRGFYGKVSLVEHLPTGKLYALKTIHKRRLVELQELPAVRSEAQVLRSLDPCPFIIGICFAFQTDYKFYLGLEYVPNGELLQYLRDLPVMSIEDTRLYIAEIALALNHLHQRGIIYRDLKPENILLSKTGHVKLADFGLSKTLTITETTGTLCGTPEYLAPEVVAGQEYSFPVDYWSLGVVSFEIFYGDSPFYADSPDATFARILRDEPQFPKYGHPDGIDLMRKLLVKDPARRLDFEGLKKHRFFIGVDWDKVARCEVKPKQFQEEDGVDTDSDHSADSRSELPVDSVVNSKEHVHLSGFSFGTNSVGAASGE